MRDCPAYCTVGFVDGFVVFPTCLKTFVWPLWCEAREAATAMAVCSM